MTPDRDRLIEAGLAALKALRIRLAGEVVTWEAGVSTVVDAILTEQEKGQPPAYCAACSGHGTDVHDPGCPNSPDPAETLDLIYRTYRDTVEREFTSMREQVAIEHARSLSDDDYSGYALGLHAALAIIDQARPRIVGGDGR